MSRNSINSMHEEIEKHEQELLTAMGNNDVDTLERLIHDDLLFVIPTGETVTKEMDLNNFRSGNLKVDSVEPSQQEINIVDDTAVVTVTVNLKGTFQEQPIEGKFRYVRIWKNADGKWQVIGGAAHEI